jgi:HEAT repeat protein
VGLEVVPTDEARLGAICEVLTQQAIAARNTNDGLQAAEALSWIDLPLAELSLERLLPLDSLGATLAANGLARIGDPEAARALILAFDRQVNPWTRMAIRASLQALKPSPKDPELRKRLEFILSHEAVVLAEPN